MKPGSVKVVLRRFMFDGFKRSKVKAIANEYLPHTSEYVFQTGLTHENKIAEPIVVFVFAPAVVELPISDATGKPSGQS